VLNGLILAVALATGCYLAFSRRLAASTSWQAIATPLASIMGSGFLVSAPLLAGVVGNLALLCMAALLLLAYAVGGAIRFNIRHFEPIERGHGADIKIVDVAHETGFSDHAHFVRFFRRLAGMTPRDYRATLTSE
jgi:AraC-like DNA-binding protein